MAHKESSGCFLLTVHNVAFQLRLMKNIRAAIMEDKYPDFIKKFLADNFPDENYPKWACDALAAVGVNV